jgi:hypothetical protein
VVSVVDLGAVAEWLDVVPGEERRRVRRWCSIEEHGIVAARVRPGHHATVVDICAGGVLLETGHRLLPNTAVELFLVGASRQGAIRGRVVRCSVARVFASAIWYRGALEFERRLGWFDDREPSSVGGTGSAWTIVQPNR